MYADIVTKSMRIAIDETNRRRAFQQEYNTAHGIIPQGIRKAVRDITDRVKALAEARSPQSNETPKDLNREQAYHLIKELESQMKRSAKALEFEKAALLRDQVMELRKVLVMDPGESSKEKVNPLID